MSTAPIAPVVDAPAPPRGMMEVVLTLDLDGYRSMGADITTVRGRLGLPSWSTPTEVIAAALRQAAT